MRLHTQSILVLIVTIPCVSFCADIEVGGDGGFGFYQDATITNANGTAKAGFGPRFVFGGLIGRDWGKHLGFEGRYTFQDGDVALRSQGHEANLDGDAQSVLGEVLVYANSKESRFRVFAAAGSGVKIYQATQLIAGPRPLTDFASLVKGSQATALVTFGGGVKYTLSPHWILRLDVRDYATPFPTGVITPAPGARVSGWLHDIVPTLGISHIF
jgi:hypothetical protein